MTWGFRPIPGRPGVSRALLPEELGLTMEQIDSMPWNESHPYWTNPLQRGWWHPPMPLHYYNPKYGKGYGSIYGPWGRYIK